jgi:branched-chain amino acid transport system substrate-binding protein
MQTSIHKLQQCMVALALTFAICLPAAAQECEVRLGAAGPMSGPASAWGLAAKAGADFVAALNNESGGVMMGNRKCRIKVVAVDALGTPAGAAAASHYLASENVRAVVGPVLSAEITGFRPNSKRNAQVNFTSAYMPTVIGPEFPLVFHANQSPATWGPALVKAAKDQFKFSSLLIIAPNDTGGVESAKQYLKIYGDLGVKTAEEYYQRGTTNFQPIAQRVVNAKPDVIELNSVPPADLIVLVRQLGEAGYTGVFGNSGGAGIAPMLQGAGGAQNLRQAFWGELSPVDHPGSVKMRQEYERLMKSTPPESPLFPVFVVAAEQLVHGISLAGTDQDGEKLAEAMRKTTPESRFMGKAGWRGKAMYGVNQELSFPVGLGMVVDGARQPVRTIEIASE